MNNDYIYDIETFPNVFTIAIKNHTTEQFYCYELSNRTNTIGQLVQFILTLKHAKARMVGFNNVSFDYPVLHYILQNPHVSVHDIYQKSMSIINADHDKRFNHIIWDRDRHVEQLDLFKIHHFDNVAKFTSLKVLEFNMRSGNIQDLPYKPGTYLTDEQVEVLLQYNKHDVNETEKFYIESLDAIKFREYLSKKHSRNFMNHNDTKIGKDFFIMKLEESSPGSCYVKVGGRRQPKQTPRESISFKDVIFPYVSFDHPEFNRILQWFQSTTITETKGSIKDLACAIDGFKFNFGTGGIHGAISNKIYCANDQYSIQLKDVTSYYPSLAIVNRVYPEHLGEKFCDIYEEVFEQRASYKKGTPENGMLKLALNGTYGDSNNKYSPFYDPKYTMTITVNGQLLLCMLAGQLMKISDLEMIMINTDGLAYRCKKSSLDHVEKVCNWWQQLTHLNLETDQINRYFSKDVNNYIMEYVE